MKNKAVFLDRDGTLNIDYGYVKSPSELVLFDDVPMALKKLKDNDFILIVITNQSGVARGYMTENDIIETNNYLNKLLLERANVKIDKFYYCPHHPDFGPGDIYDCRKPSPKMVLEAVEDFKIDLSKSYFIGDTISDMLCATNAGVNKSIMVKTSKNKEYEKLKSVPQLKVDFIADNFNQATDFILKDLKEAN